MMDPKHPSSPVELDEKAGGPSPWGHQDQRESWVHCGAAARRTRRPDRLRHLDGGTPPRFESQLRSKPDESFRAADAVVERHS